MVNSRRPGAPPRDPERTRRRLIAAARVAFVRDGYAGASLDAMTRAAGVNKALVRYHFGGKRGLYNAVLLEDLRAAQGRLEALAVDPGPPESRFERLIETFAFFYQARPSVAFLLTREQMEGAPRLDREVLDALFAFFATTRRLLDDGIAAGRLRRFDPHHVHLMVVGSLLFFLLTAPARESYVRRRLLPGPPLAWNDHVAIVRSILLHGLAGPAPAAAKRSARRGHSPSKSRPERRRP